jgi:hypothetical protein
MAPRRGQHHQAAFLPFKVSELRDRPIHIMVGEKRAPVSLNSIWLKHAG